MTVKSQRTSGFTLIEVLVVVAIIALLVSILIPTLNEARRQARRAVCGSNLHQIGVALLTYRETHKQFPHQVLTEYDVATARGNATTFWPLSVHSAIARYVGKANKVRPNEVFYCPTVRENDRGADADRIETLPGAADGDAPPGVKPIDAEWYHITYSYFGRLDMGKKNDPASVPRPGDVDRNGDGTIDKHDLPRKRTHYVTKDPDSQRILMADQVALWYGAKGGPKWRVNHGPWYDQPLQAGMKLPFIGQQMGYGDGHVEWHKAYQFPEELRRSAPYATLKNIALLVRDVDLYWW